jgi:hypothetical protein
MSDFGIGFVLKKIQKSAEVTVLLAVASARHPAFQDILGLCCVVNCFSATGRIMPDDHEIEDLRKQESRRGRRPVDIDARRQRQRYLAALRKIVEEGTEDDLKLALRQIGLSEDSPEYAEALRIWRGGCR